MVCEWSSLGPVIFSSPHKFCLCFNYLDISDAPVSVCVVWPHPLGTILQLSPSPKTCFLNHICPELALPLFSVKFLTTPATRPVISSWSFPSYLAITWILLITGGFWLEACCDLLDYLSVTYSWLSPPVLLRPLWTWMKTWRNPSPVLRLSAGPLKSKRSL